MKLHSNSNIKYFCFAVFSGMRNGGGPAGGGMRRGGGGGPGPMRGGGGRDMNRGAPYARDGGRGGDFGGRGAGPMRNGNIPEKIFKFIQSSNL